MTKRRQSLGREGETRAARFLESRGYRIVARNVRVARVEIDLIVGRGRLLVFVEVKSRRSSGPDGFGSHTQAAEAVDTRKQARLRRGARAWLDEHSDLRTRVSRVRFDVVTCLLDDPAWCDAREAGPQSETTAPREERWSIEHWESAF